MSVKITKDDITVEKGKFKVKAIINIVDELGALTSSNDFHSVTAVKDSLGQIGRLGRAAGTHLALATQKASSAVVSGDLMNNIQQSVLLGDFDSGISTNMFEKDISHLAKPKIKGRGFTKNAGDIVEFQSFWTDPAKDFKMVDKRLVQRVQEWKDNKNKSLDITKEESNFPSFKDVLEESKETHPEPIKPPNISAFKKEAPLIEPDLDKMKEIREALAEKPGSTKVDKPIIHDFVPNNITKVNKEFPDIKEVNTTSNKLVKDPSNEEIQYKTKLKEHKSDSKIKIKINSNRKVKIKIKEK